MSKTPLTYTNDNILRCSSASNSQAYLRRPSKDTKAPGFKSPLKSGITNKAAANSPVQYPSKQGYAWMHLKSPTEKVAHQIMPSVDHYDSKENCSFETKLMLSTKPDNKKSYLALNIDKSLSTYNKLGNSSQLKSPQMTSLNLAERDVRSPLLAEPPKKASLPTNLKLTLEKICTKGGSSTHRAHLSSPTSEQTHKLLGGNEAHRKSGRLPGAESKIKLNQEGSSRTPSNSYAKCKLSTLLVGLAQPNTNKKPAKQSLRDVNSVNVTPRQDYNEVYSIEEKTEAMKKYNKLLMVLKEKNTEIKRLSQDKSNLESTLGSVVEELKILRHAQGTTKERAASLADTKDNTGSTGSTGSTTGQRSDDSKPQSQNPSFLSNAQLSTKNAGNKETKITKALSSPNGAFKNTKGHSDRSGKSWVTAVSNKETVSQKNNGARSGMQEKSAEQKNQVHEDDDKDEYLKEIDEQFEQQKPSFNKVYISAFGREKTRQQPEKKEREATSVDEGALRRRASYGFELDKRKASLQEGLDIGGALSELKGRIEKLLKNKNKEDSAKTKQLYQNLQEHFQKMT